MRPEGDSLDVGPRLAGALKSLFADRARGVIRIDEIDGKPAERSVWADAFLSVGFRAGYKGLELDRSASRAGTSPAARVRHHRDTH